MTYFKVLNGLESHHGGKGRYPGINRWTKHLNGELEACSYGYHLADETQLLDWIGPTVYEAEPCPDHDLIDAGDKWVTCQVRLTRKLAWDDRIARLFAADVAESALLGERASGREPDERSWAAVVAARAYANGEITAVDLAAARAAARNAAWDAAWNAAGARNAAWDAAWNAATERLIAYLYDQPIPAVTALYGDTR